ncbi:hypothetical protein JX265_011240 [Neoarthrinium moseri]|uniref:Tetratricopeptide repeat protein 1 n=1 Tax=Neoarthrinium moseri TaxID=1658444 RepID=A0A9P9WCP3_9PEZI|nr:hypothetical protein JX266_007952 [Neoarthrinium moseri]KAI1857505.1 hypothetical protein JX265_011240 [Neoarthrinium moseri]
MAASPDVKAPAAAGEQEDEAVELLSESNDKKAEANRLFSSASYENAIAKYDEAASVCPHYLDYELAVLQSNIAACHLKLEQWKDAISTATKAIDGLERVEKAEFSEREEAKQGAPRGDDDDDVEDEIVSSGAQRSAPAPKHESEADKARQKRTEDILRIRAKAMMRRARARSEAGGWANLSGAEEDYKLLAAMPNLSPADKKIVSAQLRALPPRTKAAQEKEMGEMWGKLKDLGNGLLKPFGLSTENFNMVKDEKTGGYSMNFNQN